MPFMEKILEEINKAGLKFLEPLSPDKMYIIIVNEAIKLAKGDEGLILLKTNHGLKTVYGSTPATASVKPRKRGYAYQAYRTKKAFVVHSEDMKGHDMGTVKLGVRSWLFIPLSYKNKSIGALVVRSFKDKAFTQQQLKILELFGSMASLAIKKTQAYEETKKALEVRDLFIAMAAHELRTPLTTINGYIQLLRSKTQTDTSILSKWTDELFWESKRLTRLIGELLEINKIKTGQLQYNWKDCSIRNVVQKALNNFQFNYPKRTVSFIDELQNGNDIIIGDSEKLLQAVTNLLDNAVKYSADHTRIVLTLKSNIQHVILEVKDEGTGIHQKDMPLVFQEFYKGENRKEDKRGIGVGLFLTKNIIAQHHGSIQLYSKIEAGTRVEIKLPKLKA